MLYTEKDVKKVINTLWFEGAGNADRGDVPNCRIRTAFINKEGIKIYLELTGIEVTKGMASKFWGYQNVGFVDYCIEIGAVEERYNFEIKRKNFEYSMAGILDFVNTYCGGDFESIAVTDMFFGYRVHKDGGGYNFMNDFNFDIEKANKAREAYNKIDYEIREKLGEKYSKISLASIGEDCITVRCYASDKSMREHGLDPDVRYITVDFEGEE